MVRQRIDAVWKGAERGWTLDLLLLLSLGLYYGLLQNKFWIPSNDGEFYVSIARNLALGKGYQWNGAPVVLVPPGWPLLLAAAMKLSASFRFLNLLSMGFLLGSSLVYYRILRRLSGAWQAFASVLIAGILFESYRLSFIQFSDAFFCLLLALAIWTGFRLRETRGRFAGVFALVVLCAAAVAVRWTALFGWFVVAGALLWGQNRIRFSRSWGLVALSALATFGTFLGIRSHLRQAALRAQCAGASAYLAEAGPARTASLHKSAGHFRVDSNAAGFGVMVENTHSIGRRRTRIDALGQSEYRVLQKRWWKKYPGNLMLAGQWLTSLYWPPGQLAASSKWIGWISNLAGWVLVVLFLLVLPAAWRKREWIWFGVLLHCGALCAIWPSTPRYFIPIAPLLVLGMLKGFDVLRSTWSFGPARKAVIVCEAGLLATVVLCNVSLYAVSVWVNRSDDFYGTYRAGQCAQLVAAAHYLQQRDPEDGAVAVNETYINLNWKRRNTFGCRALNMLLGRQIRSVPEEVCWGEPNDRLVEWAKQQNVKFYFYRPPVSPWRLWHFRVPWLQERMTGKPVQENPFWVLYELRDGKFVKISPPPVRDWPTRLAGL